MNASQTSTGPGNRIGFGSKIQDRPSCQTSDEAGEAEQPGHRACEQPLAPRLPPLGRPAAPARSCDGGGGGGHLRCRPPSSLRTSGSRPGRTGLPASARAGRSEDSRSQTWSRSAWNSGSWRLARLRGRGRSTVDDLLDPPGAVGDDGDPVGQRDRLVDAVGDEDDRLAGRGDDLGELLLHDLAGHRVDRGERLVHQQQPGLGDERAGQADALPHAAGELARVGLLEAGRARPSRCSAATLRPWCRSRCGAASRARSGRSTRRCATASGRSPGRPLRGRARGRSPACRRP